MPDKQEAKYEAIAVSIKELQKWGCPHCGYRHGFPSILPGISGQKWICNDCKRTSVALDEGIRSTIQFGDVYHELQDHPRSGTPSHGRPDTRPEGGGEFFEIIESSTSSAPGCFICGREYTTIHIAAFVKCKDAGERVVTMFDGIGVWFVDDSCLPHIRVYACAEHSYNLMKLHTLTHKDDTITKEIIAEARS